MSQPHAMLTRTELAARWNVSLPTINKYIAEKAIKPNKVTNMFSLVYIEAIECEGIDLETVSAFRLRALERENERLREEKAALKGTLFQLAAMANEATARITKEQLGSKLL